MDRESKIKHYEGIFLTCSWSLRKKKHGLILFDVRTKWECPFKIYKSSPIKSLLLCAAFSTGKVVIVLQPIEKFNRKRFFNF